MLCEKPLAQTVEGCERIKEAKEDLVVLPAHNYVYTPALYRMEEKVKQGAIGEVKYVKLNFENNLGMYGSKTDFRTKDPRGIVEDVMPHILSVAGIVAGQARESNRSLRHLQEVRGLRQPPRHRRDGAGRSPRLHGELDADHPHLRRSHRGREGKTHERLRHKSLQLHHRSRRQEDEDKRKRHRVGTSTSSSLSTLASPSSTGTSTDSSTGVESQGSQ